MLYDLATLCWIIGFASATVLAIGIATYQNYKKYIEQQQPHNSRYDKESKEQSEEIDKWKRKVFRP